MCLDGHISANIKKRGLRILVDNPLYEYLLDIQERRLTLLETLAPRRHFSMQGWIGISIVLLWLVDFAVPAPALKGFPIALIILVGPFAVIGGLFIAGWNHQMLALKAYPSPLDYPRALELLLCTPLTETEIVAGTIGAYTRFPFIGLSIKRLGLVLMNFLLITFAITESGIRGTLPREVLWLSLDLYLPAFCVFIFFPVLSAIDILLVPSGWLSRRPEDTPRPMESVFGRSGRLPAIAMLLIMIPVMYRVSHLEHSQLHALQWVLTWACPGIILILAGTITTIISVLPNHILQIRRGE